MKAVLYHQYGPADVLKLGEIDRPTIKANELLIKVMACEVTKADCELRSLKFPVKWFAVPLRLAMGFRKPRRPVLGGYFSGVVEQVGDSVSQFQSGDEIAGSAGLRMGAYGEYMVLAEDASLEIKPANISFIEAAASLLGGLNAVHFINQANIKAGEKVLINGAGGSIGLFAVQLARNLGAEITVVDASHKQSMLRLLGADHFIDYQKENYLDAGQSYDVIFDMVASSHYRKTLKCLRPQGRYLSGNPRLSLMLSSMWYNLVSQKSISWAFAGESREELHKLMLQLGHGQLQAQVDQVYAMKDVVEAHRRVESEQRLGSVVLDISAG